MSQFDDMDPEELSEWDRTMNSVWLLGVYLFGVLSGAVMAAVIVAGRAS